MEFLSKHKIVIARSLGAFMLIAGFISYFWLTPKEGVSQNELAAANVARMEAKVAGGSSGKAQPSKPDTSPFMSEFKKTREKHMQLLTILTMLLGAGFLVYSFIRRR